VTNEGLLNVTNDEAKIALRAVLDNHAVGTVLHLLSVLIQEDALAAQRGADDRGTEQLVHAANTLFVVGLGLHALLPR